ncbi:MAG: hypothetical protein ACPG88_09585, partial [Porticoccaceae bacterium]
MTAALGLSAGAVGWSGMANARVEESAFQFLLLPEHYELMDNGVVVFKLEAGENLSLTSDQYLILEDGLLLITDELAQASISTHPVVGSVRAQSMSDIQPVRSPDGSVVQASDDSPLWSGVGPAPRLSEQVELQRYEIAQAIDGSSNEVGEAIAVDPSFSISALAMFGVLVTRDQPEGDAEVVETLAPPAPTAPPSGEFWTDADVADSASTAITGSSGDSFVGYTAASTSAMTDPLTAVGNGSGNTATFDMSTGGNNYLLAGEGAGRGGVFTYTGGAGSDTLEFGAYLGYSQGQATFDMTKGGRNSLSAEESAGNKFGSLDYRGGPGDDSLTFGNGLAGAGAATFDMSLGGNNTFVAGNGAGNLSGRIDYTGGSGDDTLTFGTDLGGQGGSVSLDLSGGSNSVLALSGAASSFGEIVYSGGSGSDTLVFGHGLANSAG